MSQFKVVITDFGAPDSDMEKAELHESGLDIELVRLNTHSSEEIIQHAADADGLLVGFAQINRQVIEHLDRCKVISRYGIGMDMVDLEAATERGILVCNVPDYCIQEVSTHTIAFLLCLNRHIHYHDKHVHSGKWASPPGGPPARLHGQVLGLVGLGNIGQAVARKAQAIGLCVLAYDPHIAQEKAGKMDVELTTLEDLLHRSDYVSLHCPLTEKTHHMIGQTQLELMKPSAFLINMARGPVVDQPALYQALVKHTIRGAALDVVEQEPPPPDEPLLQLENVICTPHTSSWSAEAVSQLRRDTARNVVIVLNGGVPRSVVNRKELHLPDPTD
jgi:D-3-phosphoglycerate dehydrogenase